jgi:malate dehydrogenase (oxaloacetate-decarboxylating)(NADP+)
VLTVEGALGGISNPDKQTSHIDDRTKAWVNTSVKDGADLFEVVKTFKPQVLLGLTACPGVFTEEILRTMAANTTRPIIMPMSNPTSRCECTAEEAYRYTGACFSLANEWLNYATMFPDGKAIVATGSPFDTVRLADGRSFTPSQCNNMYVFPGLGLGAYLAGADVITDNMLYVSAVACAEALSADEVSKGQTFPHINRIREVSHAVG